MEKMILTDYRTVAELIKAFHGVQVTRRGDDYSGVYYEVTIHDRSKPRIHPRQTKARRGPANSRRKRKR